MSLGVGNALYQEQDTRVQNPRSWICPVLGELSLIRIQASVSRSIKIADQSSTTFMLVAALIGTQACCNMVARGELIGVAVLAIIGAVLIALAQSKQLISN